MNSLGIVIDYAEQSRCKVMTRQGILKGKYARNLFYLCPEKLHPWKKKLTTTNLCL